MGVPAARPQIHLHIAGTRRGVADLNDRAAKIRPAFDTHKTGVQNANGSAIGRLKPVALQPLVAPDGLEQAFRRRRIFVAQGIASAKVRTPIGVKIVSRRRHCGLLLRLRLSKVKPARNNFERIQWRFCRFIKQRFFLGGGIFVGRNPEFIARLRQRFDERQCNDCSDGFDETLRRSYGGGGHFVHGCARRNCRFAH